MIKSETKILIDKNQFEINAIQNNVRHLQPILQKVVEEARQFDVNINTEDIAGAINDPKNWIFNKITEKIETPVIAGGLKMNRQKFLETLELPDLSNFIDAVKNLIEANRNNQGKTLSFLTISDGRAEIDQAKMNDHTERNSTYAEGADEIELLEAFNAIAGSLNKFNELLENDYTHEPVSPLNLVDFILHFQKESRFKINPIKFKEIIYKKK